jgi:hypothetical protein
LESIDPGLSPRLDGTARRFLADVDDPDVRIRVARDVLTEVDAGQKIFDSGSVWRLFDDRSMYRIRFRSDRLGPVPYKEARFTKDFTEGDVRLHRPYFDDAEPVNPLEYPLDELLMVHLLSQGRGAEIHACGLVDAFGQGHLFVGHSGAGKTTMARLWESPGVTILSDDRVVLRRNDGEIWMYGTPWHGEAGFAAPQSARLSRIYFLRHAESGEGAALDRLTGADVVAKLFTRCFVPFYHPGALEFALEFLEGVALSVPAYALTFEPERSAVEFIEHFQG